MADMTRVLVVSAVSLLLGCASTPPGEYRQAVARPAPAGPLIVQQPPSYPGATYTPAGAGAYRGDPLPSKPVPRSPNKRVLPATREPGIWAADGAPQASMPYRIFDVEIPFPADARTVDGKRQTGECASGVMLALLSSRLHDEMMAHPFAARRCMAAQAYRSCAGLEIERALRLKAQGEEYDADALERLRNMQAHARALEAAWCSGVELTPAQLRTRDAVLGELAP